MGIWQYLPWRKTKKNFIQDNWLAAQESNSVPPEYKAVNRDVRHMKWQTLFSAEMASGIRLGIDLYLYPLFDVTTEFCGNGDE
jgi:hypothetical protein